MVRGFVMMLVVVVFPQWVLASDVRLCRGNDWQPTYVSDVVSGDPTPYYVMPDGSFTILTGDWVNQSGPGMCALYGVRDDTYFSGCFQYRQLQCGCDAKSVDNDVCKKLLIHTGSKSITGGKSDLWQTSQGEMTFLGDVSSGHLAEYGDDQGRVLGQYRGGVLDGYWVEEKSRQRCDTEKDGSFYWGKVLFSFDEARTSFDGYWGYCNKRPTSKWRGTSKR